jgi:hypothetical protein
LFLIIGITKPQRTATAATVIRIISTVAITEETPLFDFINYLRISYL